MAWNRSPEKKEEVKKQPPKLGGGLIAGLVVVLVALGAVLYLTRSNGEKATVKTERKVERIKEVTPAPAPKAKEEPPKEDPKKAEMRARAEKLKKMTPEERLEFLFEEAKKKPLDLTPSTNRTFKTGTEQIMSWIFTTRLGDPPPPLPQISLRDEAHLAEILIADNPILETDSERAKEAKKTVEAVKKEAMKYIKEGGDIQEFFQYYRDQLSQAYHEYTDARKTVLDMLKNGEDGELCSAYIKKVNERLAERGIEKKIEIPDKLFEKFTGQKQVKPQAEEIQQ